MENSGNIGILYLCATPIGNLDDITLRVLKVLETADFIAAEDTRHTAKLLHHFGIKTPMISYHEHNARERGAAILPRLLAGETCALVTDAGMPAISDPGADLVKLCVAANVCVTVCPGASACVSALAMSGLDTERFLFDGFLPANNRERKERIDGYKKETRTIILYEAPHRLRKTLSELKDALGETRKAAVVKELTKIYEKAERGTLLSLCDAFSENEIKGEFVLIISGVPEQELKDEQKRQWEEITVVEHVKMYTEQGLSEMDAIKAAAKDRGVAKSEIYAIVKERKA